MPCSWTPGSRAAGPPDLRVLRLGSSMLPSAAPTASASQCDYFGAESHSLLARCLRFAVTVTRAVFFYDHARLASGWRPCLSRTEAFLRKWVPIRGFGPTSAMSFHPPHPSFAWRNGALPQAGIGTRRWRYDVQHIATHSVNPQRAPGTCARRQSLLGRCPRLVSGRAVGATTCST